MRELIIKANYRYIEYDTDIEFFKELDNYLNLGYIITDTIYLAIELKKNDEFLLLSYIHIDNPTINIKNEIWAKYTPLEVEYPDYTDTLLNITSEIRANFGYPYKYKSKDKVIKRHYSKIAILILDGLGENVMLSDLEENSFLRRHYYKSIHALYPSTTAAATTSIISGLTPLESGWCGWENYIEELNKNIILFNGIDFDTGEPLGRTGYDFMPYKPFFSDMMVKSEMLMPDFSKKDYDFRLSLNKSIELFNQNNEMLQYIYCTNPDTLLHGYGVGSNESKDFLKWVDKEIEDYAKSLPKDTLIIISADHGHTNVEEIRLYAFNRLMSMLNRRPCNEARCLVFDVKNECKLEFEDLFNKVFGSIYRLYKTRDAIELGFFGKNNSYINPRINTFLGNYIALASNKYYFKYLPDKDNKPIHFKSHHAGITRNEMIIPIILIDSNEEK